MAWKCWQVWKGVHPGLKYSILMGAIISIALFVSLYVYPAFPQGEFVYVGAPASEFSYVGPIHVPEDTDIPGDLWMPELVLQKRSYNLEDMRTLAERFGMHNFRIVDHGDFYDAHTRNATLIVSKEGLYLKYHLADVPMENVSLGEGEIVSIARNYMDSNPDLFPSGVTLRLQGVETGRQFIGAGYRINTTMVVNYRAYFIDYLVDLPVQIEVDSRGRVVGLSTSTVAVVSRDYIVIPSFSEALKWMESEGIPLPEEYDNLYVVTLDNVTEGYALWTEDSSRMLPGYYVTVAVLDSRGVEIGRVSVYVAWMY